MDPIWRNAVHPAHQGSHPCLKDFHEKNVQEWLLQRMPRGP